jgi:hypothetical protein
MLSIFLIIGCAISIWLAALDVKGTDLNGVVYTAEPLNACTPLTIKASKGPPSPFVLIIRGGCPFDEKIRNAQDAGFKTAIVYDNENSGILISSNLPYYSQLLCSPFAC